MKILQFCLVLAAVAMFIFACSENKTTNSNTTATTNKPAVNANTTTTQPTVAVDELASAKKIYADKCVRCHKEDGTGGKTEIDGVKINAENLTSDKMKKEPDSEYIEAIEKGFPDDGMPAYKGKISDQDIKDLVKLIRRDFQK
jgi:mono/diheme cytochrome c family protein